MFFDLFIYIQLCFLRLVMLIFRYKYFLVILILMELIIINISILIYLVFGKRDVIRSNFYLLFSFRVESERVIFNYFGFIIRYYEDNYYEDNY